MLLNIYFYHGEKRDNFISKLSMPQQAQVTTPSTLAPYMKFSECSIKPDLLHETFLCILLFSLIYHRFRAYV